MCWLTSFAPFLTKLRLSHLCLPYKTLRNKRIIEKGEAKALNFTVPIVTREVTHVTLVEPSMDDIPIIINILDPFLMLLSLKGMVYF